MSKLLLKRNNLLERLHTKSYWVGILCLVMLLLSAAGPVVAQGNGILEEHINRLVKEAIGVQPIRNSGSPSQNAFDRAFRLQYRALIQANRDYEGALKQIDSNVIRQLGTPQSLATPANAAPGLRQMHLGYTLEVQHEQRVQEIYAGLKRIFETADWAAPRRQQLVELFESMTVVPSLERQRCISAEKAWIDSMDDLYRYTSEHSTDVHLVEGAITIDDTTIQRDFNAKIISTEAHRRVFLKAKQEYAGMQAQAFRALAVDRKRLVYSK
jgi:hypothetical protein